MRGGAVVGSEQVTELIQSVLMQPWSESVPILMPVAKLALLGVAVIGVTGKGPYAKVVLGYYAAILAVMAVFQNTATLPDGVAIIVGNLLAQLVVVAVCLLGLRHTSDTASLRRAGCGCCPSCCGPGSTPSPSRAPPSFPAGGPRCWSTVLA